MHILKAATLYFGLVFGIGFLLGTVRVLLLVPWLGVRYAELLEMPLMFVAILLAARYIVRRFELFTTLMLRLRVGLLALAMLVLAEFFLAAVLQGRSVGEYIASRDPVAGSVYLAMLLLFALMPAILSRTGSGGLSSEHGPA